MSNLATSIIRTIVPVLVGTVVTWLQIRLGVTIDDATSASLVATATGITVALYYIAVRWLEVRFPQIGWLLGLAKAPGYSSAEAPPPQPSPGANPDAGYVLAVVAAAMAVVALVLVLTA